MDELDHLEHYLRHYETLQKPGYAVLVTGEWGVGKTTQVKRVLKSIYDEQWRSRGDPKPHVYVSLFGMSSIDEIDADVVAQLNPGASWLAKAIPIGGGVAGIIRGGAATAALAAKLAGPILRRELQDNDGRTVVFDDLERSKLRSASLAGVLNRYIEHFGFRVILIAHDEKFAGAFKDSREKLIGQTIRVYPQIDAAWTEFTSNLRPKKKKEFIVKHGVPIRQGFEGSGAQSLRILRHVTEDVGRLFDALDDDLVRNESACAEYLGWFAKFDALFRCGGISSEDISNPDRLLVPSEEQKKEGRKANSFYDVARETLNGAYRMNTIETKLAKSIFVDGLYDRAEIKRALEQSAPFFSLGDQPAWQIVWHRYEIEAEAFIAARDKMEAQFASCDFTSIEEILHVFGLRLSLAEERLLGKVSVPRVEQQCLGYLETLETDRRYAQRGLDDRFTLDSLTGAFGLGFSGSQYEQSKLVFDRLFKALKDSYRKFLHAGLPEHSDRLLTLLGDPAGLQAFFEDRAIRYLPLFLAVNPKLFVARIFDVPSLRLRQISTLLHQRFNSNTDLFDQERQSVKALIDEFDSQLEARKNSSTESDRLAAVQFRWFFTSRLRSRIALGPEQEMASGDDPS